MPSFDATATSQEVVEAFKAQVKGKTFVITGAGQPSIGSKMATDLAKGSPAHILIASRTKSKVNPVLAAINETDSSIKTTFVQVDLSDHDSVRRAANEILAAAPKIHVLINSAGNMALKEYQVDKQGIELQLSANHVGHFLLTNLLTPALITAASTSGVNSRVVNLTSSGYKITKFRFDDYNFSDGKEYDPWTGYGQAKAANVLFSYGLTQRLKNKGVISFATHPGYNGDTMLGAHVKYEDYGAIPGIVLRNMGKSFEFEEPRFKTYDQIAATSLIAALDPELEDKAPAFLMNSAVSEPEEHVTDPEAVEGLWELSERLVGEGFGY